MAGWRLRKAPEETPLPQEGRSIPQRAPAILQRSLQSFPWKDSVVIMGNGRTRFAMIDVPNCHHGAISRIKTASDLISML